MPDVLHIIVIVEKIQRLLQVLDRTLVSQLHPRLRNHGHLGGNRHHTRLFQCRVHTAPLVGIRIDFVAVLLLGKILRACVQSGHHQIVRIHVALFLVDDDKAFLVKHEGDAALCADAAVTLGKGASHVGGCTVNVIRQRIHNNCHAAWTISLVGDILVIHVSAFAGCLPDAPVDGIVGHVVGFRLGDHLGQLKVVRRIGTALLHRHRNFPADDCKDFPFRRIVLFFLMFDICKF